MEDNYIEKSHKHLCGFTLSHMHDLVTAERGCGHIFKHKSNNKDHRCPKCGNYVNKTILSKSLLLKYEQYKIIIKYHNPFNKEKKSIN